MKSSPFAVFNLADDFQVTASFDCKSYLSVLLASGVDPVIWLQEAFLYSSEIYSYSLMHIPYSIYWIYYPEAEVMDAIHLVFQHQLDRLSFANPETIFAYSKSIAIIEFCLDILDQDKKFLK